MGPGESLHIQYHVQEDQELMNEISGYFDQASRQNGLR
jgi:hypothetical protein